MHKYATLNTKYCITNIQTNAYTYTYTYTYTYAYTCLRLSLEGALSYDFFVFLFFLFYVYKIFFCILWYVCHAPHYWLSKGTSWGGSAGGGIANILLDYWHFECYWHLLDYWHFEQIKKTSVPVSLSSLLSPLSPPPLTPLFCPFSIFLSLPPSAIFLGLAWWSCCCARLSRLSQASSLERVSDSISILVSLLDIE